MSDYLKLQSTSSGGGVGRSHVVADLATYGEGASSNATAALNALAIALLADDGGVVQFEAGTYRAQELLMHPKLEWRGAGRSSTIIKTPDGGTTKAVFYRPVDLASNPAASGYTWGANGITDCPIRDLTIHGNGISHNGMHFGAIGWACIRDVTVTSCTQWGIDLTGVIGLKMDFVTVKSCGKGMRFRENPDAIAGIDGGIKTPSNLNILDHCSSRSISAGPAFEFRDGGHFTLRDCDMEAITNAGSPAIVVANLYWEEAHGIEVDGLWAEVCNTDSLIQIDAGSFIREYSIRRMNYSYSSGTKPTNGIVINANGGGKTHAIIEHCNLAEIATGLKVTGTNGTIIRRACPRLGTVSDPNTLVIDGGGNS